ncbi:hypothetical protein SAMN02799630_03948 [Paenibacillus sp. UNCCL117]|uniref:hypothetical protein n=1 Tax=unclassified Paenibacillus TaxID=185978 RepID=UPI000890F49D|nr:MULTISPECIES: hypothetical protein [unclassified Paenibacillus]SDD75691.1 hypothetical protein SAMN04488602_11314 [Paenibacillus sp. cl123]SFW52243.1 hypothetical protein SAMN02799630_03948 [Paenibacillus sp. UNCCL117]
MAYPADIDRFQDKLNKRKDGGIYIVEEELPTTEGVYEGLLAHDHIVNSSIQVYTGSKFTGEPVVNFVVSVPAETPWRRTLRAFSTAPVIYVTYETPGDTVEADDVNRLQRGVTATQVEVDRYKASNDQRVRSAEDRLTAAESAKANKTYVDTQLLTKADKATTYTKTETDQRIQSVIGAAPAALDTLQELGAALNNDPNFAATVTTQLSTKVDKAAGKQLSTEDYTTAEKTKLAGIAAGANAYVHPSTHPPSIIVQDASNRFVTDAEKAAWTAKASTAVATSGGNGLMSAADKVKLDGVASGANAYVHPSGDGNQHVPATGTGSGGKVLKAGTTAGSAAWGVVDWSEVTGKPSVYAPAAHTHPADEVTESAAKRFVTDAEKAAWTAKASTAVATSGGNGLMSAADKVKLDGVASGANAYVHPSGDGNQHVPATGTVSGGKVLKAGTTAGSAAWGVVDWSEVTGKPSTYAPAAHTHSADEVTESAAKRFVTDAEKAAWTAKASTAVATSGGNGLMSAADKVKLDGITSGANSYVHPTGDGNQHVPATGTVSGGKVLKAGTTAGSVAWGVVDWSEVSGKPSAFAAAAHDHARLQRTDDRVIKPTGTPKGFLGLYFTSLGGLNAATGDNQYQDMIVLNTFTDTSGGKVNALAFHKTSMKILHFQAAQGDTVWGTPKELAYMPDVMSKGPLTWNQLKGV